MISQGYAVSRTQMAPRPKRVYTVNQKKLETLNNKVKRVSEYIGCAVGAVVTGVIFAVLLRLPSFAQMGVGSKFTMAFAGGAFTGLFFGFVPSMILSPKINLWRATEEETTRLDG